MAKHWESHPQYIEGCFGCKALTLQMNAGDAVRDVAGKQWDSELQAYRDARAQGIQPAGTSRRHIEAAYEASAKLNRPYDADVMPKAQNITKGTVEVMKEIGMV